MADPSDTLVSPKPAWPFLFLYQALKLFPGPLEPLGTAGAHFGDYFTLCFFTFCADKSPEKNPFKRGFVVLAGFAFVGIVLYLTRGLGLFTGPMLKTLKWKRQHLSTTSVFMKKIEEKNAALNDRIQAMVAAANGGQAKLQANNFLKL